MSCKDNKDGSCSVEYVPHTPGLYEVNITYGGEHIPGEVTFSHRFKYSLFFSDEVNTSATHGQNLKGVRANIPQSFTVDCRKAGEAPLAVAVTGPKGLAEPVEVIDNGDGTHTVSYTPSVEGPYSDQDGKPKQPSIHDNDDGTYTVSYVPDRTGRYTIVIKYGGDDIPASPYRVRATASGDASKCTVTGPGVGPTVAIGEELGLVVNAKGAGKGKVSCVVVQPDGSEVEAEVLENEDGTFDIFYTALAPGNYAIYVRFGGENIPRSPFKVMVRGRGIIVAVTSEGYQPVGSSVNGSGFRPFDMIIPFSFRTGEITGKRSIIPVLFPAICCEVLMPSGKSAQPLITDNLDGRVTVQYSPTEAGLHEMHIKYNGTHIPESPLQFYVNHASSPNVTAYGPGLSYGVANKVAAFTVYTDDASEGTVATGETGITPGY
ncbi:hypothetical protein XENOCAPTIV_028615 [Xenoophorus captivus]|uniref:Uncharacterized protein n=1 Tax=Xenoophorus captivus TaxID=1517983 RepID=A0ABV0QEY2_9TELE